MRPLGVLGRAATLWRRPLAALALAAGLVAAPQAAADDLIVPEAPAAETIRASLGKAVPLRAAGGIQRVVVSQPEIAQVRLAGSDQLYVIGLEVGATNLLIYDTEGRLSQTLDVQVGYDAGALQESLDQLLPERSLTVTPLARGVLIEGEVTTPAEAEVVRALAERVAPEAVITQVHIQDQSVQVDVQIVETSSDRLREIGAALSIRNESIALATRDAPIGVEAAQLSALARGRAEGFDLRGSLRALEERGEARVLAQPIVVVASGETGSARAGGELPFPVPTDPDRVVVEFRPYGAGVKVKPTLQANGLVKLELEAELSEIDPQARVRLGGINVPALLVRRTASTVELADGETLMVAGLLERTSRRQGRSPFLGGELLRRLAGVERRQDRERELAIFVTPRVSKHAPMTDGAEDPAANSPEAAPTPLTHEVIPNGDRAQSGKKTWLRKALTEATRPAHWLYKTARKVMRAVT